MEQWQKEVEKKTHGGAMAYFNGQWQGKVGCPMGFCGGSGEWIEKKGD